MIVSANFTIVTNNLERAASFYREILKLPLKHYVKDTIAIFEVNSMFFQIYQETNENSHHLLRNDEHKGSVIIGFNVSQPLEKTKESLISQNVKIRAHIFNDANSPIDMLFIEDYDGNEICLSQFEGINKSEALSTETFYNNMSESYHLIFEDWDNSIEIQSRVISALLPMPQNLGPVLDCACGIGTQIIGLKKLGYIIEGSDLSSQEVERAIKESAKRNLSIDIRVDDMRTLQTALPNHYGAVLAMDNAIPHLSSNEEIFQTLLAMKERLKPGGIILISLRDYEPLIASRPKMTEPVFFHDNNGTRSIHQVWDWKDERNYFVHLYITHQELKIWKVKHFLGQYRAVTIKEIESLMRKAGLEEISVLSPLETGYHQPIIRSVKI